MIVWVELDMKWSGEVCESLRKFVGVGKVICGFMVFKGIYGHFGGFWRFMGI